MFVELPYSENGISIEKPKPKEKCKGSLGSSSVRFLRNKVKRMRGEKIQEE